MEGFEVWQLATRYWDRVNKAIVLYNSFPVPFLPHPTLRFDIFRYSNLKLIIQKTPDRNSPVWAKTVTFPKGISGHITHSLSNPEGPLAVPKNDLWKRIEEDVNSKPESRFVALYVHTQGYEIRTKYRYKLTVQENFGWPFPFEYKTVLDRDYESVSLSHSPPQLL
jgi:hypothetical protein